MSHYFRRQRCASGFSVVSNKHDPFFPFPSLSCFFFIILSLCFAPSVGPSVRNERWPLIRQKILLYRADPLSTKWKRSADESGLVLFAPLLDVAHRLELNRSDGLSVQEGSCMANSCQFLLASSYVSFPLSLSFRLSFVPFFLLLLSVLFGTIGRDGGDRQIVFDERFRAWNGVINVNK